MRPYFWNTDRLKNVYRVSGKWRNWLNGRDWSSIVAEFSSDRTAGQIPFEAQIPLSSQGECILLSDNVFSMRRRVLEQNDDNSEPSIEFSVQALTQTNATGHSEAPGQWRYPNAWPTADLLYRLRHGRAVRMEKIVEINTNTVPEANLSYSFRVRGASSTPFIAGRRSGDREKQLVNPEQMDVSSLFMAKGDSELRGMTISPAEGWFIRDGEEIRVPVSMSAQVVDSETVEFTKHISPSLVQQAKDAGSKLWTDATFYPDANPETSTVDGYVNHTNTGGLDFGVLRGEAGNFAGASDTQASIRFLHADGITNKWQRMIRCPMLFDTASLHGSIESAILSVYTAASNGDFNEEVNVYSSNPASNTDLVAGDYDTIGSTAYSTGIQTGSLGSGAYNTWTLNASGRSAIDLAGITKFALASEADRDNTGPAWGANQEDSATIRFAEYSGTGSDPYLTATLVAVAGTERHYYHHLMAR